MKINENNPGDQNQTGANVSANANPGPLPRRDEIAKIVTWFVLCLVSVSILSAFFFLMFYCGPTKDADFTKLKDIISMVLPLLGTWIGTVLAYYFAKDNFNAANDSVKKLVSIATTDRVADNIKVTDKEILIPLADIKYYKYTDATSMSTVKLSDIIAFASANNVLRIPFIDGASTLKFCIHRSIIDKFISLEVLNPPANGKKATDLTFNDLLTTGRDEIKNYVNAGFAFLKADATLLNAKLIIDHNKFCQDVFVTQTGSGAEPVIGWLTDGKILEKSKV